jgi:hypothetical protein
VEKDGFIHWAQPEILLYDPDPAVRMSYPCLVEEDDRFWVTETNKTEARIHEIDGALLKGLWEQGGAGRVMREGLLAEQGTGPSLTGTLKLPEPINLKKSTGVTLEIWFQLSDLSPGQVLLDGRDPAGKGMALTTMEGGALGILLDDGACKAAWSCDPGLLEEDTLHHAVAIVDARAGIISFVMDGLLCDGGDVRQYGWGRIAEAPGDVSGKGALSIAPSLRGEVKRVRVYRRYLKTSEAVANFLAGF